MSGWCWSRPAGGSGDRPPARTVPGAGSARSLDAAGPAGRAPFPTALARLDESSELYINAASTGFVLELPPFAGIDTETLGALAGTLADAAPERCTVQVLHWASPRFGASAEAWAAPRAGAGGAMARMGQRRGALLAHGGWRKLHPGGPPFTLSDYRVFVTACLAGGPGPAAETALGAFHRALEGTLASAGAHARRLEPDALLSLARNWSRRIFMASATGKRSGPSGAGRRAIPSTNSALPLAARSRSRPPGSRSIIPTARTTRPAGTSPSGCSAPSPFPRSGRAGAAMR